MGLRCKHASEYMSSLALAFLDKTQPIVIGLTAACLLYTRSAGVGHFVAGASTCTFTVKLIKRTIRQPRPPPSLAGRKAKASYGMPSTHSATITFFATYILLACRFLPIHWTLPQNPVIIRLIPPLVTLPWALAVIVSRVWLGYHTWPQVAAGSAYGVGATLVWFSLWTMTELSEVGRYLEEAAGHWFSL